MDDMKRCKNCGEWKTKDQFSRLHISADGLQYWCKVCDRERQRKRRSGELPRRQTVRDDGKQRCRRCGEWKFATGEFFNAAKKYKSGYKTTCRDCETSIQRKYREENREHVLQRNRAYTAKNREHLRELETIRREGNRENYREKQRKWNAANPEKAREKTRRYNERYPEKVKIGKRVSQANRAARKNEVADTFTATELVQMMEYWNYCCVYCSAQQDFWNVIEQDHFIALTDKRENNPGTVATNMIPACASCNASKNDSDPIEWLNWKFGKRKAKQILKRINDYFEYVKQNGA